MATPYVAGVAALYISEHGGRSDHGKGLASDLGMRIISSGTSLDSVTYPDIVDTDFKASTFQIGNGLVNALKVIDSTISLDLQRFAHNDTRRTRSHQDVTVRNNGDSKLGFTFDLEAAAGYEILQDYYEIDFVEEFPRIKAWREMTPIRAKAGFQAPEGFELGPGQSAKARFVFDTPQGLNATALPLYSGKVLIKASNNEELSVPFQGLGFDLKGQMENNKMSSGA